jgi:putative SOS response-associated peptidase YedK
MCYSAQLHQAYEQYVRRWGADIDLREFARLYGFRAADPRIKIPKAMDANFRSPRNDQERAILALIEAHDQRRTSELEQELFKQRKRLADADRKLRERPTKAAAESQRIAGGKVEWVLGKLAELRRATLEEEDSRIFPGWYAPVMIFEDGRYVVRPMRYQCRPAGKPAHYDRTYPGTYNARRDNLTGFWRNQFGSTHALVIAAAFYENVSRHRMEGRELTPGEKEENVVLAFEPRPRSEMLVACLWSRWQAPGEPDLYSFAAITDDPPPEVAAAGHDRCIIPIKTQNVEAWLRPGADPGVLERILDDRERPYYEHRLAA